MTDLNSHPRFRYIADCINHEVYDTSKAKSLKYLADNLADENWRLRGECTKLKLMLGTVIEDLEKQAESGEPIIISKDYVEWIKSECDVELLSQKEMKE